MKKQNENVQKLCLVLRKSPQHIYPKKALEMNLQLLSLIFWDSLYKITNIKNIQNDRRKNNKNKDRNVN